jgi:hypothetical protein
MQQRSVMTRCCAERAFGWVSCALAVPRAAIQWQRPAVSWTAALRSAALRCMQLLPDADKPEVADAIGACTHLHATALRAVRGSVLLELLSVWLLRGTPDRARNSAAPLLTSAVCREACTPSAASRPTRHESHS